MQHFYALVWSVISNLSFCLLLYNRYLLLERRMLLENLCVFFISNRDMSKCEEERQKIVLDTRNKYVYCRSQFFASINIQSLEYRHIHHHQTQISLLQVKILHKLYDKHQHILWFHVQAMWPRKLSVDQRLCCTVQ